MKKLIVKMLLVAMLIIVFGAFQYGGIGTAAPFHNSWQTWLVGVALLMSVLILLQEVFVLKSWKTV